MREFVDAFRAAKYAFDMVRYGVVKRAVTSIVLSWTIDKPQYSTVDYATLAESGYAFNALIWACIREIATSAAEAPLRVYERAASGDIVEIPDHPLRQLIRRPNPYQTEFEFIEDTLTLLNIAGNAYIELERNRADRIVGLWPIRPDRMAVIPGGDKIRGYEYTIGDQSAYLPRRDVIHIRYPNPLNDYYGMSPIAAIARIADIDNSAIDFIKMFFDNGAVPLGIFKTRRRIDQIEADRIKGRWKDRLQGNWHDIAVIDAEGEYQQVGVDLAQLDLTSLTNLTESRICAAFGVPPVIVGANVGLERSTYCLPANARVWMPTGSKRIIDILPGDMVWSFSFVNGTLEPRAVVRSGKTGFKRLYKIKTKNRTLLATGNHPLLTRVAGRTGGVANYLRHASYTWKRVDELSVGDRLVQPKSLPDQGKDRLPDGSPATPEIMQFLGAIIGDGTVTAGVGVRMAMPPNDRCCNYYRNLAAGLFTKQTGGGIRPWKRAHDELTEQMVDLRQSGETYAAIGERFGKDRGTVWSRVYNATHSKPVVTEPIVLQERQRDFGFSSARDSYRLANWGFGGRAHTKRIPGWIYEMRCDLRLAFIAGIVDTDGSIDERGALSFGFCNEDLTEDIRQLAIGAGLQCSNLLHQVFSPDVLPNPGIQDEYHSWRFVISSAKQVSKIPFSDPVYRQRVESNMHRYKTDGFDAQKAGLSGDLGFYSIVSIQEMDTQDVYDIEVEGGHSFVADGVVVHNSNYSEARRHLWDETLVPIYVRMAQKIDVGSEN